MMLRRSLTRYGQTQTGRGSNEHQGQGKLDMRSRLHFELDLCKFLEDRGYNCFRSAGSRGPADVYAINKDHLRIIQLKTTIDFSRAGNLSIFCDAIEKLHTLPCPPHATHELWVKPLRKNWRYIVVSDFDWIDRPDLRRIVSMAQWVEA